MCCDPRYNREILVEKKKGFKLIRLYISESHRFEIFYVLDLLLCLGSTRNWHMLTRENTTMMKKAKSVNTIGFHLFESFDELEEFFFSLSRNTNSYYLTDTKLKNP